MFQCHRWANGKDDCFNTKLIETCGKTLPAKSKQRENSIFSLQDKKRHELPNHTPSNGIFFIVAIQIKKEMGFYWLA